MSDKMLYAIVVLGWLQATAAVVSTFSKTMIRLRFASVLGNICGLLIGVASVNLASLLRHLVILPIDIIRLREMQMLVAKVKNASRSDLNVEWLKPFMQPRRFRKGEVLFHMDSKAEEAFILVEGELELSKVGVVLTPGALFGEMALFTPTRTRTATISCRTDGHLLSITYEQFEQLYFQNPEFGLYLVRLIVSRLGSRLTQSEAIHGVGGMTASRDIAAVGASAATDRKGSTAAGQTVDAAAEANQDEAEGATASRQGGRRRDRQVSNVAGRAAS